MDNTQQIITPAKPKPKRKKRRAVKSSITRRRSRYTVAALQAAYRVARDEKAHFSYRLEAARIITALENGLALQLKITGHDLRRAIKEEIERGDVSEQLLSIAGIVRKIEQDQRRIVAPVVGSSQQPESHEPVPESAPPPSVPVQPPAKDFNDLLRDALKGLEADPKKGVPIPESTPAPAKPTTPAPPVAPEIRLSEEELRAVFDFAELRISAQELESSLQPFLRIDWGGMDRDRITSVTLTGARFRPEDRTLITPALIERAQNLALSPSPRDQQTVREWVQVITRAPMFTTTKEVLGELLCLKQQLGL